MIRIFEYPNKFPRATEFGKKLFTRHFFNDIYIFEKEKVCE